MLVRGSVNLLSGQRNYSLNPPDVCAQDTSSQSSPTAYFAGTQNISRHKRILQDLQGELHKGTGGAFSPSNSSDETER